MADNPGNSPLCAVRIPSPNYTSGRKGCRIERITPHCVVGQLTAEGILNCFVPKSRKASSNYVIGKDGKIGVSVDECNRSWCTSNSDNDNRAVTIECASDKVAPYRFNNSVYNALAVLCADIMMRNGKTSAVWIPDKSKALAYRPKSYEILFTVHRWFAAKSCPGDWLYMRMGSLAETVNAIVGGR